MAKRLVVLAGPDEGRAYALENDTFLLGRSRATDTKLIDPHVSRVHCQIDKQGDQFVLSDFDSAGGTFVNGAKVSQHTLKVGDIIQIGATHLQVAEKADAGKPAPSAAAPAGAGKRNVADSLVGKEVGQFKFGALLARGRNGYVFHGRDKKRNHPLVLKVLDEKRIANQKDLERFGKAMKAAMAVRHPHLLRVYGAGRTGGNCYIAEEYVPGESLAAVIRRIDKPGQLDWRLAIRLGIYVAKALHTAHSKKLLHLGVCPHNILLGKTPQQTKLSDLMLAYAIADVPTRPVSAAGLPSEGLPYQPPERTSKSGKAGPQCDIYSLGATLYAMIAGKPPFQAATVTELVAKIRTKPIATLKSLNVTTDDLFEKVLMKMLAKNPKNRFATMREVLRYLLHVAKKAGVDL